MLDSVLHLEAVKKMKLNGTMNTTVAMATATSPQPYFFTNLTILYASISRLVRNLERGMINSAIKKKRTTFPAVERP